MKTLKKKYKNALLPSVQARKLAESKRVRKATFWYIVGDSVPFMAIGYIFGYILGAGVVFYVFAWPLIKALFFGE